MLKHQVVFVSFAVLAASATTMSAGFGAVESSLIKMERLAGEEEARPPDIKPAGSDRDEHGCIPSAGYIWCNETGRCERPWELAGKQGFENSREAFDRFCGNRAKLNHEGEIPDIWKNQDE